MNELETDSDCGFVSHSPFNVEESINANPYLAGWILYENLINLDALTQNRFISVHIH
jgi:hypothetical protein